MQTSKIANRSGLSGTVDTTHFGAGLDSYLQMRVKTVGKA
jgi:hypothetical protein